VVKGESLLMGVCSLTVAYSPRIYLESSWNRLQQFSDAVCTVWSVQA